MIKNYLINKKINNFIYCGGKCGSTTIFNSLKNSYHTHNLLYFLRANKNFNDNFNKVNFNIFDVLNQNMKKYNTKNINIYDSYRTPIERKISAFFQHLNTIDIQYFINEIKEKYYYFSFDIKNITKNNFINYFDKNINHLIEIFWWCFMIHTDNYYPFQEYENIKKFDISNKEYYIQKEKNFTYIILKFDHINKWNNQLSKILNENIILKNSNLTKEKNNINKLYKNFKENFTIPSVLFKLIMLKNHKMHEFIPICNHLEVMKQFLNENEIIEYFEKWKSKFNNKVPEYLFNENLETNDILKDIDNYFKNSK